MRSRIRLCILAVCMCVLGLGCGGRVIESPAEDPNVLSFESGTYHLDPGQERYLCFTGNLPADRDVAITHVTPVYGKGVHHIFFSWTLAPEAEGSFECPILFKLSWIPIYLGGAGSDPLSMPEGTGLTVPKGNQILLQLHLQNTGSKAIDDHVTMKMSVADKTPDLIPAGIFGLDNRAIDIPADTSGVKTSMGCQVKRDMNVFAMLGHMHKLGKHIALSRQGPEMLFQEDWSFADQPIVPTSFALKKSDQLELECTHDNPLDHAVKYGESSDTEMCVGILYYTPYDKLDGCLQTQ